MGSSYKDRAKEIVNKLSLDEKVRLSQGQDFWSTLPVEHAGLPSIYMTDGPHGLRKGLGDLMSGNFDSVPATCFPTAAGLAATWNTELAGRIGVAIGAEAQSQDVQVVLGPGVNMKRSPLGGRNFEYFSEDPVLAGDLAAAYVTGVQSQGIGTSVKHYAANNQEFERMTNDSVVDERTLHEIYLTAFERAMAAKPWSVMVSYNKVNGTPATENKYLLSDILRTRWGYEGVVLSDWTAVMHQATAIAAGLNLQMPGFVQASHEEVLQAIGTGELSERKLDDSLEVLVANILWAHDHKRTDASYDEHAHHQLARNAAAEAVVMLKNDDSILPLTYDKYKKVAVVGRFAKEPRYQGAGSSKVHPTKLDTLLESLRYQLGSGVEVKYTSGYDAEGETTEELITKAAALAGDADVVVFAGGLPASHESEGFDRTHIDIPEGHEQLIHALSGASRGKLVVVLMNGSVVRLPWEREAAAILEAWLGGQAGGSGLAEVLTGRVNPSGKLPETVPMELAQTPAHPYFPGKGGTSVYGEGLFIGYRWYEAKHLRPKYPFGFGLSYTTFEISELTLSGEQVQYDGQLEVTAKATNTGYQAGAEVVQLYIGASDAPLTRPAKELKHFRKVFLQPGETTQVTFTLSSRDFAYYDPREHDWIVAPGEFTVYVGSSSRDIAAKQAFTVINEAWSARPLTTGSFLRELKDHPVGKKIYVALTGQMPAEIAVMLGDTPLSRFSAMSPLMTPHAIEALVAYANDPEHHHDPFSPRGALETFGLKQMIQLAVDKFKHH